MDNKMLMKIMIAAVAFIGGFVLGSLWTENKLLKTGTLGTTGTGTGTPTATAPSVPNSQALSKMPEITDADHVRGNPDADILLVEYSDYECPFCNRFHPTMQQLMADYGDKIGWVYRHFPLTSIHPQAQISAEAAECVAKLSDNDTFWEYSDRLFEEASIGGGQALTREKLLTYASELGVNSSAVDSCLTNGETTDLVNEDAAGGRSAGITGTPGTILMTKDGKFELISGALPVDQVKTIIDQYL